MLDIKKDKKYLLACSFGPDSMALFAMLLKENVDFDVVHVNYHLRKESDSEEEQLKAFCKEYNKQLYVFQNDQKLTNNIEERCREIRYQFFKQIYDQNGYEALLVAHNQDDLIETYLMQKHRKNLVIFYGIQRDVSLFGMRVVRPLLAFPKDSLKQYCDDNKVPYSIDKTNLLPIYTRNKIRLDVVSKMDDEEKELVIKEIKCKNDELEQLFDNLSQVSPSVEQLLKLNDIELAYYLNNFINKDHYVFNITYKQVLEVRKILESGNPNITLLLKNGKYILVKAYDSILFKENEVQNGYSFVITEPQLIDNEYLYADLLSDTSNRNISPCDYPLTIRTYKQGDKYQIKEYQVQVRRLFIDWKMPTDIRKRWPIVVNKEGKIIYIPRYRKDFKPDKVSNFYVKECFTLN